MTQLLIINLSGYLFVSLPESELPSLRADIKAKALFCDLKGTILLSPEGINAFVAGARESVDEFVAYLNAIPAFSALVFKESVSAYPPFNRMLVRLKKEIIPMNQSGVAPEKKTAPYVTAETLREWYRQKKDMVVLDTRNDFEIALGTFENAMDLHLSHFRDFNDAIEFLPETMKEKTVVTFCTGGIRCEKAAELMTQKGFKNVYQLEGGILKYFEKCGGDFYEGDCFVFDQRVALNSALQETQTMQCFDCRTPLHASQVRDAKCPHCGSKAISKQAA